QANAVVTADFNHDGKTDMAVVNQLTSTVTLLLSDSAGGFTMKTATTGTRSTNLTAADLNGDGLLDLIVTNTLDDTVGVLMGKSIDGSFQPAVNYTTGNQPVAVATADVNLAGKLDVMVA